MIELIDINNAEPYKKFLKYYSAALKANQYLVEAISISSFSKLNNEVNSRYVNLKYIHDESWIFFSNYNSPKAIEFQDHNQVSALFYWNSINVQIRMRAKIKRTTDEFNQNYFFNRSEEKNALAISSNQSEPIESYSQVKENYNKSLKNDDLKKCPEFWGGYSFTPYYFEFWEGHESRLNKREVYEKSNDSWKHLFLQP
jgi:pyridoxamine 5'-phosphate oxidase